MTKLEIGDYLLITKENITSGLPENYEWECRRAFISRFRDDNLALIAVPEFNFYFFVRMETAEKMRDDYLKFIRKEKNDARPDSDSR